MAGGVKRGLIEAAAGARRRAVAPYSHFRVGAALLTRDGQIITGANVESASYGLTCCAERVALFAGLTAGLRDFVAVAVVARAPGGAMPCGACRQLLAEYAPAAKVWVADSRDLRTIRTYTVKRLLPRAFTDVPQPWFRASLGRPTSRREQGLIRGEEESAGPR
jgi:cytidine deaminase